jgi:hypothetical protein
MAVDRESKLAGGLKGAYRAVQLHEAISNFDRPNRRPFVESPLYDLLVCGAVAAVAFLLFWLL